MRFAAIKTVEQQSALSRHRTHEMLVKQTTMLVNLLRRCRAESGIVAPSGIWHVSELVTVVRDKADDRLPAEARFAMMTVADQLDDAQRRIQTIDGQFCAGTGKMKPAVAWRPFPA
jgi:transposase